MPEVELHAGDPSQDVRIAQQLMDSDLRLRPPLQLDGVFGPLIGAAVIRYQTGRGLAANGVIGHDTLGSLAGHPAAAVKHAVHPINRRFRRLHAPLAHAEPAAASTSPEVKCV